MPSPFSLPPCLLDCYKVLYPNLDFSRITFYEGMPAAAGSPKGFTMSAGGPSPDINIYVSAYQPCSKDTFLTIAHELVHAVQIQGMTGGGHIPGSWSAYYLSHWLGCAGAAPSATTSWRRKRMTSPTADAAATDSCGISSTPRPTAPCHANAQGRHGRHRTPSARNPSSRR